MTKKKGISSKSVFLFFLAAFFLALPGFLNGYDGHTGKFIVAAGPHEGPFEGTVIYLLKHGFWESHGVVINKPLNRDKLQRSFPEIDWNANLYDGGPVEFGDRNFVLLDEEKPERPNIKVTHELPPELIESFNKNENAEQVKVFIGYAGWGVWQLNQEINSGGWFVIDYDPALIYETPASDIWSKANAKVREKKPRPRRGSA
jgi:putative transcriptional regulator